MALATHITLYGQLSGFPSYYRGRRGCDRIVVGFTTPCAISSNPIHGEVYSIQHYVIKFVSDLRQVGGFLWFPPPIKLTATT